MGRMLMFLIVGMGILFSMSSIRMNQSNVRAMTNASMNWEVAQARNISKSGIEMAMMEIAKDTNWLQGYNGRTVNSGSLNVSVQVTQAKYPDGPNVGLLSTRLITSTSTVNGKQFTIRSVATITKTDATPPALKYAICSQGTLSLVGNCSVQDDNNPQCNANVHSNSNMSITGSVLVKGYGTYSGSISGGSSSIFVPNVNYGGPSYYKTNTMPIPTFNPYQYESIATEKTYTNLTLSGNIAMGSKENPKIWFVAGNLSLSGTVTGYGVFIVAGNINLTGNVTVNGMDPTGNNLGLYTSGCVNFNGNITVHAQILSNGNANMNGNVTMRGSLVTGGTIVNSGNVYFYYRPYLKELTNPFWPATVGRPVVISYLE